MEEEENGCAAIFIIPLCIFLGAWVIMETWNDLAPFFLGEVNIMSYKFALKCALSLFAMRVLLK